MRKSFRSLSPAPSPLAALGLRRGRRSRPTTEPELPEQHWHFKGPFGTYDRAAAQRGYQVYKEVCSACHSLNAAVLPQPRWSSASPRTR